MNDRIDQLIEERAKSWGDPVATHARIAQVWSGIFGREVTALQVSLCMEGLKLIRAEINPDDPDSFDDAQGYSKISAKIAGHNDQQPELVTPTEGRRIQATLGECAELGCHRPRLLYYLFCEEHASLENRRVQPV